MKVLKNSYIEAMATAQEFEKAKAFLKQADAKGISLYDHLTNILLKLNNDRPPNAIEAFEEISKAVKNSALTPTCLKELPPMQSDSERVHASIILLFCLLIFLFVGADN
jgi:hypothetical protein